MKKIAQKIYKWVNRKHNPDYFWKVRSRALNNNSVFRLIYKFKYYRLVRLNGASIPLKAKFTECPDFPHGMNGIFISSGAQIGKGCTIFHQVTIGSNTLRDSKNHGAPIVGDNVYIGAGAKIIGGVKVGNNVRIGANCVVTQDIPENSTVVLPAPVVILHSESRENKFVPWNEYLEGDIV